MIDHTLASSSDRCPFLSILLVSPVQYKIPYVHVLRTLLYYACTVDLRMRSNDFRSWDRVNKANPL